MQLILKVSSHKSAIKLAELLKQHINFSDVFHETNNGKNHQYGNQLLSKKEQHSGDSKYEKVIVVIGGDGFMLSQLRKALDKDSHIPHFGINVGSSGFLLNSEKTTNLIDRINKSHEIKLPILHVRAYFNKEQYTDDYAINEVTLLRMSPQSSHLELHIDKTKRLAKLVSDGLIVSSPAGSTGYNSSLQGPILPLESKIWAMTPISPFRPRRWRGALLSQSSKIAISVLRHLKRPVSVTVDNKSIGSITEAEISLATNKSLTLLFDSNSHLQERITKEQFTA